MSNTVALLRTVKSSDGSYAPYKRSVLLTGPILSTYRACISLWHQSTVCYGSYGKSSWRIVRSVQTVRIANGPYSEYIRSVHLKMASGHSVLSVRAVRTNRNGPYAWLIRTVLIPRYMSYINRKAKQAPSNSNIPRSVSDKPQQARYKCNISRSISHILKQARFKCNIPRSISHKTTRSALQV